MSHRSLEDALREAGGAVELARNSQIGPYVYSTWPNDRLMVDDHVVGVSTFSGYRYNERSYLSLAIADPFLRRSAWPNALAWRGERGLPSTRGGSVTRPAKPATTASGRGK